MDKIRKFIIDIPDLIIEWDYARNNEMGLSPENITSGSSKKAFWICQKHKKQYCQTIKNKSNGQRGCQLCQAEFLQNTNPQRYLKGKLSLADKYQDLLKEWDFDKNDILPTQVTAGSGKYVWWKCTKGHEWQARICNRTSGSACIYCTGQKPITGTNDLISTNPELLDKWDWEKNGELRPELFMKGSNKKVWWRCALGHSWQATISHITSGTGCPHCFSENQTSFAEQSIVFYLSKHTLVENRKQIKGYEIDIFLPDYQIGFEYDGIRYHSSDRNRNKEKDKDLFCCQCGIELYHIKESDKFEFDRSNKVIYCYPDVDYKYIEIVIKFIKEIVNIDLGEVNISRDRISIYNQYLHSIKENSITTKFPFLIDEWNYEKNGNLLPQNFTTGSNKKVWWRCSRCNSSYETSIARKVNGTNCPYCAGKKVNETNSLLSVFPELVEQWDYELNKDIKPNNIYYSSRLQVWWICKTCGKSYKMAVCQKIKTKTSMCSSCMHLHIGRKNRQIAVQKVGSLYDVKLDFLEEWDYEKNTTLTPRDVTCKSGIKVWWKCRNCGNEWKTSIYNRYSGTACPKCYGKI